ncbi:MAG: DUF3021 family protein [Spirochaetaceae bacterium]|nr:DUF3021 family protein [Spirochaetaceae bacterium]
MRTIQKIINETLITFGILTAIFAILTVFVGEEAKSVSSLFESGNLAIPVKSVFQFFVLSFLTTLLKNGMYSNYMIKKLPRVLRQIILFVLCFILLVIMILVCGWFATDSKLPWLLTAIAFVLSFSSTIIITTILEQKDDDKMNSALEKFK